MILILILMSSGSGNCSCLMSFWYVMFVFVEYCICEYLIAQVIDDL